MRDLQIDGHSLSLDSLREVARQHRQTPPARGPTAHAPQPRVGPRCGEGKLGGAAVYESTRLSAPGSHPHSRGSDPAALPQPHPLTPPASARRFPRMARGMMLLRANALAQGASGCRPVLVERLLELLNHRVYLKSLSKGAAAPPVISPRSRTWD